MASVFNHGDLRLYLLSLLAEGPRHGYDLMRALSERTGGTYTPSAGTIYPRLSKLEDEGLVEKQANGRKTVYSITERGRAEVEARADDIAGIQDGLADSVRLIAAGVRASVNDAMRALRADLAASQASGPSQPSSESVGGDSRTVSRQHLHRAETVVAAFRAGVRADLRSHVARGGVLTAAEVDGLGAALDRVSHELRQALGGPEGR